MYERCYSFDESYHKCCTEKNGESYPTVSITIHIVRGLRDQLQKVIVETSIGQKFNSMLMRRVEEKFSDH